MIQPNFDKINERLMAAESILIVTHRKPDGDACGSALAILDYLLAKGKKAEIFTADLPPSYFDFLPQIEKIKSDQSILKKKWELVVVLDSSDLNYTGVDFNFLKDAFIINIDHHWSNGRFGDLNLVDHTASSTSELIFSFLKEVGFVIHQPVATCLLAGILSDTGGFTNSATSFKAMQAASELIRAGAKIHRITESVVHNKSIDGLRLWGRIFSRLKINQKLGVAYTYVIEDELRKYKVDEEEIDGLVNFLNVITGVNASMFFRISAKEAKVSLRTTIDGIDLAKLAGVFGGGGHKKAAGFTVPWTILEKDGGLEAI